MKTIADVMTRNVRSMKPSDSIILAAQAMDELDVGVIPVCDGNLLVGVLTDRDIVLRGVARGRAGKDTCLREVMSADVAFCFEDQSVAQVLDTMGDRQIRRVPVVDREQRLVGIVSLGDVATKADDASIEETLGEISFPSGSDRGLPPSHGDAIPSGMGFY
ncbi:MAG: histidine kinase [Herbaspirillum sp.]|jgi:CBS domain-containing protein|nr:histidine kinase [Herbaspirillum sp.]